MPENARRVVERIRFLSKKLDGAGGFDCPDSNDELSPKETWNILTVRKARLQRQAVASATIESGEHWLQPPLTRRECRTLRMMKIKFKRLNHVQICIPPGDEDKARKFYGGVLGLEEIEKPEALKTNGGLWFAIADIQLHIGVEDMQSKSKRHPAFEVEGLEQIRAYLSKNGVKTKDEIKVPGMSRISFFDPFDNRIELMEKTTT